jgi:hypothetical protein
MPGDTGYRIKLPEGEWKLLYCVEDFTPRVLIETAW